MIKKALAIALIATAATASAQHSREYYELRDAIRETEERLFYQQKELERMREEMKDEEMWRQIKRNSFQPSDYYEPYYEERRP